MKLGNSVMDVS